MLLQPNIRIIEAWNNACFNTASGRCCCNCREELGYAIIDRVVSIPQAVGAVATSLKPPAIEHEYWLVSIPQAVGAVATWIIRIIYRQFIIIKFQYRKR